MRLILNDEQLQTIEQAKQFLKGSEAVEFKGLTVEEKYRWIEEVLIRFKYHRLKRDDKGMMRRYIERITGYSRAQVSRFIREYRRTGWLKRTEYRRHRFHRKYTLSGIEL